MVKLNKIVRAFTHEGAKARRFTPEMALKRALMNCLLWENQFYENGVSIAEIFTNEGTGTLVVEDLNALSAAEQQPGT